MALPLPAGARDRVTYDAGSWGESADTLKAPITGPRHTLRSAFLVPGSLRVFVDGVELPPERFQANPHLGTLRILADVAPGSLVIVRYQRLPVLIAPVYSLRATEVSSPDSTTVVATRAVKGSEKPDEGISPDLTFGGTKSVSFSTGSNRGSTLDQSLEATVEGRLTPTIKVRALLSDNNLPIQPEGNTEELEYFDKVFVEMEGPNARAAVGDIAIDNRLSTFSPVTRQLRGLSGALWNTRGRVGVTAAETKGEFRTAEFRGTTGLQGPYALLSPGRTTTEVIIAGTERVYVDGVRFERGPNRDYIIDYDAGAITFTPRRLITTDSEIAVDFEVTQARFDRTTLVGTAEQLTLGRGFLLNVLAAREADDESRPKNDPLSEDDIALLRAAGDDPAGAVTDGVTEADSARGTYVRVPADTTAGTPEFYRFDELNGNLIVLFVEVGAERGDYRRAGISPRGVAYFEFVGVGLGNYVAGRRLPVPESVALLTTRLTHASGILTVDGEWNVSEHDKNKFSSLDDDDNMGQAGQFRVGLKRRGVWTLGLEGAGSLLDERFRSFDRARPAYYYRDWNLEDVPLTGREVTGEVGVSAMRGTATGVRYTLGRLDRDTFDGLRHKAEAMLGSLADRGVAARALVTDTESPDNDRTRRAFGADVAYGLWRVVPALRVGTETYRSSYAAAADSGRAFVLAGARLTNRGGSRLTWRMDVERRETETVDAASEDWVDDRRDDTVSGGVAYRGAGSAQAELEVTHRRELDHATGATRTSDLARVKAGDAWEGIGLRADADYEVSQNDAVDLQRSVVFVGEGNGDYNEFGEAVGKGKGNFTLVFLPTTDATPVHTVGFNLRVHWKPSQRRGAQPGAGNWIVRNVSVEQLIGVREESTHEPAWEIYLLLPSALQRDDATVFGTSTFRQDWSFLDGYKNVALTLRYLREDREDNRFEGVRENTFLEEEVLRFSRSLSARLTTTVEGGHRLDRRAGEGIPGGTGSSYDIEEWSGMGGLGVVVVPGATLDVDLRATSRTDAESGAEQFLLQLQPRLVWRLADQINVFATYDQTRTSDRNETLVRPIVFARDGTAHRWSITANLRVSRMISIYGTYGGRNETVFSGREITEHEFRLETRAYF